MFSWSLKIVSKLGLLIKTYFLIFLGNLKNKKNPKNIGGGIVLLFISLIMVSTFTFTAISTTNQFLKLSESLPGAIEMAMFSNLIIGLLLIVLFTVMRSIYPPKTLDEELLLSLPYTKTEIILSKAFYNYLFDVVSYAMVLLPSFIVYYVMVPNTSFTIVIWGIVFVMLAAILSAGISYIISLLFIKLASKFKNINIVQSILTLMMLAGYMILQYSIPGYLTDFTGDPSEYINGIPIMKYLLSWILHNNMMVFLVILGITLTIYLISFRLRFYYFGKDFKTYQSKDSNLKYQALPVWKALLKKELKFYFNNTTYFINTIIGCFFVVGISVAYRIIGKDQVLVFVNALPKELQVTPDSLILILTSMLLTTTVTTSVSISLEGNNFWILKAHPVKVKDVFISKMLVNIILSTVASLISSILFGDINHPITYLAYFLIPTIVGINTSIIGLIINLMFPKFDFESVEQVVKRGLSHPLAMGLSFIVSLVPVLIYFVFGKGWSFNVFFLVTLGIDLIIMVLSYIILMTKGIKMYNKL